MFMVFAKWAIIGMIVEVFGFINLFGDFFPVILNFLRQLPFIGNVLNAPGVRGVRTGLCTSAAFTDFPFPYINRCSTNWQEHGNRRYKQTKIHSPSASQLCTTIICIDVNDKRSHKGKLAVLTRCADDICYCTIADSFFPHVRGCQPACRRSCSPTASTSGALLPFPLIAVGVRIAPFSCLGVNWSSSFALSSSSATTSSAP